MRFPHNRRHTLLFVITIIPTVLLASFFLLLVVGSLISPDVPEEALAEGTLVSAMLILTAAVLIYALFRPYSGGFFLCIWSVPFGFFFNAFHLSNVLYPSRDIGYAPFWSVITCLVLLIGVLSVIRGRLSRRTASEAPAQDSVRSEGT